MKDFTGQVFGRLKVTGFNSWHIQPSGRTGVYENDNGTFRSSITYYKDHIKLVDNVSFDEAVAARAAVELKYYGVNKE